MVSLQTFFWGDRRLTNCHRLLDYAGVYYDLKQFEKSPAKDALQRVIAKREGKLAMAASGDEPKRKKQKRDKKGKN